MKKTIRIKRIYEPAGDDGLRVLVDRLWARGIGKETIDLWLKEIAPSDELRGWYSHDPARWDEFRKRYFAELKEKEQLCRDLLNRDEPLITLLFSSRELKLNNAAALKEFLEKLQE